MRSLKRGAIAIAAAVALLGSAPANDQASELIANSAARLAPLHSYTFQIHVDFALKTFPYLKFHLDGDGSFVRPNLLSIHFRKVPWFAKGFESVSLDPLEPSTWNKTYDFTQEQTVGDRLHLEMKDRTDGHLKDVSAELDADGLRRVQWNYLNGGWIAVEVNPIHVDGFPLPQSENAEIRVPGYHVEAHATFENYQLVTDQAARGGG
jgi:hypothetical protein